MPVNALGLGAKGYHARNQEATLWVGNLEPEVTEEILWELFCQFGPIVDITMPRDKVTNTHQGYCFAEYLTSEDADYACRIANMTKLFGKPMRINKSQHDSAKKEDEFQANLFIGNLDQEVDEKMLFDIFSAFGAVLSAKVMTEPESAQSRGFGFVSFDTFESADAAIESMNGQHICNRAIHVGYAYKKDGSQGERHGSAAERLLAAKARKNVKQIKPNAAMGASGMFGARGAAAAAAAATQSTAPAMASMPSMHGGPMIGMGRGAGGPPPMQGGPPGAGVMPPRPPMMPPMGGGPPMPPMGRGPPMMGGMPMPPRPPMMPPFGGYPGMPPRPPMGYPGMPPMPPMGGRPPMPPMGGPPMPPRPPMGGPPMPPMPPAGGPPRPPGA